MQRNSLLLMFTRQWNEVGEASSALFAKYCGPSDCSCPQKFKLTRADVYSYVGPTNRAVWSVFRVRDLPQAVDDKTLVLIANYVELDTKRTKVFGGNDLLALYDDVLCKLRATTFGSSGTRRIKLLPSVGGQ